MQKRVVITGMGAVTNIGIGVEKYWNALLAGECGITDLKYIDPANNPFKTTKEGTIQDFNPADYFDKEHILKAGRASQMALKAAAESIQSAGIQLKEKNYNIGVAFGTTLGEAQEIEKFDDAFLAKSQDPSLWQISTNVFQNRIANIIASEYNLNGNCCLISNACSAANFCIGTAFEYIRSGKVDAMVIGGSDSFSRMTYTGFARLNSVAAVFPKPFSFDRDGMMPAEGAGALFVESLESAQKRKADILAEVLAHSTSCDSHHITQLNRDGLVLAYQNALKFSGIKPQDVSYISPHGTGTLLNDTTEVSALWTVFGEHLSKIPLSSVKSSLGHSMGAASALEAIVSVLAIRDQKIPATIHFSKLDESMGDIDIVPNKSREHKVDIVFECASGFGGNNSVIIFKKFD